MSLASPYQEHYYVADGSTTSFAFGQSFTALNEIDVKCIIYFEDGTNCVPVFNVNMTTGFINIVSLTKPDGTLLTVPPAGSIVRVFRKTPEAQNVTASQLQNYTAKQLERVFDSLVAMIQEISYSDIHKTVRLTETQRDIAIDYLPDDKDQAVIYWDVASRKLMPAGFGQNQVVKSDGIEWLVYNQSEGKVYFIPRQGGNPIPIGKATIHNDLSGRNAPDCHPESAITGLREHLQELRDKDSEIEVNVDIALNRSQEAVDTAEEAKETAEYAQTVAGQAKDIAEDAKDVAEGIDEKAQTALDNSEEALNKVTQEITDREDADDALQDQITDNKGAIEDHIADTNNPHSVTKAQVGLGNVDNTSDLDKPISTATQTALDLKMPISTKYGAALSLMINSTTYVVTAQLKDQDGNNLGTAQTIDLPLESVVVSGAYDSVTKEVVLTLQGGSTIRFSVADLVSGLQTEITALNMLSADLVDDTDTTHKFVSTIEKTNWNNHIVSTNNPHQVTKAQVGLGNVDNTSDLNKPISTATQAALDLKADKSTTYTKTETDTLLDTKQDTISDLATIRSNAQAGKSASDTIATYGNIVTHDVTEFATAAQGAKADTALQAGDNVSELVNDAGYLVMGDLTNFVTKNTAQTISGLKTFSADITLSGTTSIKNTTNGVSYTMLYRDASGIHVGTSTQALLLAGSNARPKFNNNDIAMLSDIPTAVSQLTNDTGFITNAVNDLQNYTLTSNLATVATSGSYNDLSDKPTIGNATLTIQKNSTTIDTFTANATSNKTIDIAVPTKTSDITNDSDYQNGTQVATAISTHNTSANAHSNQFNAITEKIPAEASSSNKLADKAFVNSSIATNTANFIGTFNSVAELEAYSGTVTNNDYAFVIVTDSAGNTAYDRYKYTTATTPASWVFEYELNNSSFTATQWAAINSGANTTNIGQIATNTTTISNHIGNTNNPHQVTKAQVGLGNVDNTSDLAKPISTATQAALNAKANTADLATVATSGSYNDLSNKPTIPTVGDGTITIKQGGTTKGIFTTNQSGDATIELDAAGGGIGNIDNLTITANADQEIQTVATINANTASGATNPIYDWVGTLAEYQAQNIETLHPDWLCYITDDVGGGESVYTKSQVDTIASGKANVALDNITNAGKEVCANLAMPSDRYTTITTPASGNSIVAPADGYFQVKGTSTAAGQRLNCDYGGGRIGFQLWSQNNNQELKVTIPVSKGGSVYLGYSISNVSIVFTYARGAQ